MTTYKKKKLKDREGNYIVTPSSADIVYCQDGSTVEQKLNNIENDEFSPTITQVESMAKVGVGTDVDVSANVQEGYVKSAILKGNTKVNLIQESSSQDVVLPYEFTEGQNVTISDTKESGALGIELKGQTKYKDVDTGDILDEFDSNKSLELVSVQVPSVTTVGKNLFDLSSFETGVEDGFEVAYLNNYTPSIIYKENTQYTVRFNSKYRNGFATKVIITHTDGSKVESMFSTTSFTTTILKSAIDKSVKSITFSQNTHDNTLKCGVYVIKGTWIEESPTPTTYEPYKSTTLTLPEEVTLRGIGNVKDTLNTVTGEYVQRIGEIVLDGSENWVATTDEGEQTIRFASATTFFKGNDELLCDKVRAEATYEKDYECIEVNAYKALVLRISKSKASTVEELKTYLSQNPITVQYELATPITSTLDLTFTDQDNAPTTKLSTYNTTTHINASSQEGSLIPTLSHVNPSYPVILKRSTKYSIVADSYSNGHTNSPINFNLGGATATTTVGNRVTTVTTPATLSNELLTMSGRGNMLNNVMVIEGDVVGDEPYFEGMCDVDMPVVTTVGKNLFDGCVPGSIDVNTGANGNNSDTIRTNFISVNNCKTYCLSELPTKSWNFIAYYDKDKKFIHRTGGGAYTSRIINPTNGFGESFPYGTKYIKLTIYQNVNTGDITTEELLEMSKSIQLEETSTPTTYESYKSTTISCNSEVVLRSLPNGVCDTLDLMTGEYVQRIGEVVLDGSEDESWGYDVTNDKANTKLYTFAYDSVAKTKDTTIDVNCNRLSTYITNTLVSGDNIGVASRRTGTNGILVRHSSTTLTNFKTYLSQNPITVQYELAEPITTTIDLVPSGTNPTTKPFVWKDGHIQLLSEQGTLTPSLEYSVITSRGGQILDNTRQIAKQDKRIYDLEMLLISSSVEDAYQRLVLQNSVQMLSYNEELKVNPIRYYMLSRLIEESMYQESDVLNKLDAFFLYGEITLEQYYELVRLIVGETVATLEEVGCDVSLEYAEEFSQTCMMLMNKLEVSIQREEDLSHYYELANAYARVNRLTHNEYEAIASRIANAYVSVLPEIVEESDEMLDLDIADEVIESETANEIQTLEE